MRFRREGFGTLSIEEMFRQFKKFIEEKPEYDYKIIIGTDSMVIAKCTRYITAVTLQRIGNGAMVFYRTSIQKNMPMYVRIMNEVNYTIETANKYIIPNCLKEDIYYPIEIHIDIGNRGISKQYKNMAIGYVKGCGFDENLIKVKPDAFGASKIADRYTR